MIEEMLSGLGRLWPLDARDVGAYAVIRKKGMRFSIRSWAVGQVGYLCAVQMEAMLGLMKMDTLVFTPLTLDAPLFSYDRILAMGKDTLLLELYDTQLAPVDLAGLARVKADYAGLPEHDLGTHWYDSLKLPPSLAKRGKGLDDHFDALCHAYFEQYLALLQASPGCDRQRKRDRVRSYVDGLLENGGPSTDQFKKLIGAAETEKLFRRFVFAAEE